MGSGTVAGAGIAIGGGDVSTTLSGAIAGVGVAEGWTSVSATACETALNSSAMRNCRLGDDIRYCCCGSAYMNSGNRWCDARFGASLPFIGKSRSAAGIESAGDQMVRLFQEYMASHDVTGCDILSQAQCVIRVRGVKRMGATGAAHRTLA